MRMRENLNLEKMATGEKAIGLERLSWQVSQLVLESQVDLSKCDDT